MDSPFQISVIALWGILTSFLVSRMNFFFFFKPVEQFLPGSLQESISGSNYHWYFLRFSCCSTGGSSETGSQWRANRNNMIRAEADGPQPAVSGFIFTCPFSLMGFVCFCFLRRLYFRQFFLCSSLKYHFYATQLILAQTSDSEAVPGHMEEKGK